LGLGKNALEKDNWFVPGGYVGKGETLKEAFQRISRDELKQNFSWEDAECLGIPPRHYYPDEQKLGKTINIHNVVLPYVTYVTEGFCLEEDDQHQEYKWFKPDELLKDDSVHSNTKDFFAEPLKIPNDSGVYRALVSHYIHYDRLFWSRTQILLAVQGAVLIGGDNLRSFWLGPTVMFLGVLITLIIWERIFRDIDNSRANERRMDQLTRKLLDYFGPERPISLRSDPPTKFIAGRNLIHYVVIGIMIINLGLGWLYIRHLNLFPPTTVNHLEKFKDDMKEMSVKQKNLEFEITEMNKSLQKIADHQIQIESLIKEKTPNKQRISSESRNECSELIHGSTRLIQPTQKAAGLISGVLPQMKRSLDLGRLIRVQYVYYLGRCLICKKSLL